MPSLLFSAQEAEQVTQIAKAENRTIRELFLKTFRAYRAGRVRTVLKASQQAGRANEHMGHESGNVERLIHEARGLR
uniref:Uncharacterized protein n=1 Tax=mine drainage metagenome TaxID=410659 RepID=E6PX31_9ZZZZ